MAKGKTRWYPRHIQPVRNGQYECLVRLMGMPNRLARWDLVWDGVGFLVPFPMIVRKWRGQTRAAARAQKKEN